MTDHRESAAAAPDDAQPPDVPDGSEVIEKPDEVDVDRDGADPDAPTEPTSPVADEAPLSDAEPVGRPDTTDLVDASSTDIDDEAADDDPADDEAASASDPGVESPAVDAAAEAAASGDVAEQDDPADDDPPDVAQDDVAEDKVTEDDVTEDEDVDLVAEGDNVPDVADAAAADGVDDTDDTDGSEAVEAVEGNKPDNDESEDDKPAVVAGQRGAASEAERAAVPQQLAALASDPSVVERLTVVGPAQVLPSVFHVTTVAATAVAAAALGAARLSAARNGGPEPTVTVDTRHAAIAFRSERYITANRRPLPNPWDPLSGYYRTADERWIQLHCNFPHHREGVLSLFGLPPDRARLERAVRSVEAEVLEGELQSMGMCAAVSRTAAEWRAHPHGRALDRLPLFEIDRIGEAPPLAFVPSAKPAAGVRVLDMTRVIAGPVCGRVLASYGARVVRVGAAHLPEVATVLVDTGFGKRNTNLDLRDSAGARRLRELVSSADVVIQAYRPKALARLGFGPEGLARLRPGLVCVSISAYGRLGPWSGLRGYDSLVQTASGVAHAGGAAYDAEPEAASHDPAVQPLPLPAQALDHATGYLGAYGALTALARRQTEGGSWHVRLSLAQTGRWLQELGPADALGTAEPGLADVEPWLGKMRSGLGELAYVRPPGALSGYTPQWDTPPTPLGSAPPSWG